MDVKKTCLKVRSAAVCLLLLIILSASFVSCVIPPTTAETSWPVMAAPTSTFGVTTSTTTSTFLVYIYVTPVRGEPGSTVAITGTGFLIKMNVKVWFDSDGDSVFDSLEPFMWLTTTDAGNFPDGIRLTVPSVPAGSYYIRVDLPTSVNVEVSVGFYVTGYMLIPWLWLAGGIVIVVIVSVLLIRHQLVKKKMEKTKEKFEKGDVAIKVSNIKGKLQIKSATPFKADKAISVRWAQNPERQSIKVKGPLVQDGKEDK